MTRKSIRDNVIDAIQDVNIDALTPEEEDEIADLVLEKLVDEVPSLVDDDDEEGGPGSEEE
jgi:predicted house-cleaning noncanonical NTP pyrophosphatase (MazG superfamily)